MGITVLPWRSSISRLSSSDSSLEPSNTARISCAVPMRSIIRCTPMFSTVSSVSLMPAQSANFSIISPSCTVSSTISRVVPSISVTMLFCTPVSRFISVDFPALGFPTMAVAMPFRSISPQSYVAIRLSIFSFTAVTLFSQSAFAISSSSSISDVIAIISSHSASILRYNAPSVCALAQERS